MIATLPAAGFEARSPVPEQNCSQRGRTAPRRSSPRLPAARYGCGGSRRRSESERPPPALRRTAAAPRLAEPGESGAPSCVARGPRSTRRGEALPRPRRSPPGALPAAGSAPLLPYLQPPLPSLRPRDPHRPRGHRRPLAAPPSPSVPGTRPEDDRWDPARRSSSDRRPLPRALPGAGSRVRSAAGREERRRERREQPRSRSRPPSPSRTQTPPPAGPASHWLRRLGPGGPRTPHWPLALSRNGTARPRQAPPHGVPAASLPRRGVAGGDGGALWRWLGWAGLGCRRRATGGGEGRSTGVPQPP